MEWLVIIIVILIILVFFSVMKKREGFSEWSYPYRYPYRFHPYTISSKYYRYY